MRRKLQGWMLAGLFFLAGCKETNIDKTEFSLHEVFSDHMVLQRDQELVFRGQAEPGAQLTVSFAGQTTGITADTTGSWQAALGPFQAGGPYRLEVTGVRTVVLDGLMVGDVWLCSGQSNMEWPVRDAANGAAEVTVANHRHIRLFTVPKRIAATPQASFAGNPQWRVVTPQTLGDFSAACYFFGRELQRQLDVPIGLIDASWGGTIIEAWSSVEAIGRLPEFQEPLEQVRRYAANPRQAKHLRKQQNRNWWASRDPGSRPGALWSDPAFPDGDWPVMSLPGAWETTKLAEFDGAVWFRKTVELPAGAADTEATLALGPIDDRDTTWVNGRQVGAMDKWREPRTYNIPKGILRAGKNTLAVRVLDSGGRGGFLGEALELSIPDLPQLSLAGLWRYQVGAELKQGEPTPPLPFNKNPKQVTVLYNGMIAPLLPLALKGVAWYQGESNADRPLQYRALLRNMIADWRTGFGRELPFVIVQLAAYNDPNDRDWPGLRESQWLVARNDPLASLVTTIDIGAADDIHPRNKQEVGRRIALSALTMVYGRDVVASGPVLQTVSRNGANIVLTFSDTTGGLATLRNELLQGFSLCYDSNECRNVAAEIRGEQVIIAPNNIEMVREIRYAWANYPECNLSNGAGLPAVPFRVTIH